LGTFRILPIDSRQRYAMRLHLSLFALSAATTLPVLGFAMLVAGLVIRPAERRHAERRPERNRATLAAVDAELRGVVSTLQAVGDRRRRWRGIRAP
jgi:hypothetical protein